MAKKSNKLSEMTRSMIEQIAMDFVVNEAPPSEIQRKYNLSPQMYYEIVHKMDLHKKRERYRKKVLDKALDRCSTYQSKIIYKATEILHGHVEKIHQSLRKQEKAILSSSEIRDVMAILQIVSKEYRLDNGKPTEASVTKVQVEFPKGYAPITQKPDVVLEESQVKEIYEPKEEQGEDIEVDDSDVLESPL